MRPARQENRPERVRETNAATTSHIRQWLDHIAPTPNALAQFKVTVKGPQTQTARHSLIRTVEVPGEEPEPTTSAEAEIHYRSARGRFKVPGKQAGHLLNLMACALATGGIVFSCLTILRSSDGSPVTRVSLCVLCVVTITGLAGTTIFRSRS
jgi:hypothetical protein